MSEVALSPRVTIGLPVYNGAATLELALASILNQTFGAIEIIISDNASTDGTAGICRAFADRDPRIRYYRQTVTTPAEVNFRFVLDEARAPYFMWAAHDDVRNPETVARLVAALDAAPEAINAFGDTIEHRDGTEQTLPLNYATSGRDLLPMLWFVSQHQHHNIYGLWRTEQLKRIRFRKLNWWPDTPVMMAAATLGEFVYAPGAVLHYRHNPRPFFKRSGVGAFVARLGDMATFVATSWDTVNRTAGPVTATAAATFAAVKVARQATGFIWRRLAR